MRVQTQFAQQPLSTAKYVFGSFRQRNQRKKEFLL